MPLLSGAHICIDHLLRMVGSYMPNGLRIHAGRCTETNFTKELVTEAFAAVSSADYAFTMAQLGFLLVFKCAQFD